MKTCLNCLYCRVWYEYGEWRSDCGHKRANEIVGKYDPEGLGIDCAEAGCTEYCEIPALGCDDDEQSLGYFDKYIAGDR